MTAEEVARGRLGVSDWPTPARADHAKFCENEGWRVVRDARGRTGTHHLTYELDLPDGRTLRTRVSHPSDRTDYGPSIWSHILRDQLAVTEAEFWACVRAATGQTVAAQLRHPRHSQRGRVPLIHRVGVTEDEVAAMSKEQAIARLNAYWRDG